MQRLVVYLFILALLAACGAPNNAPTTGSQQSSNNQNSSTAQSDPTATLIPDTPTAEPSPIVEVVPTDTPLVPTEAAPVATEAPVQQGGKPNVVTLSAPLVGETVSESVRIEGVASSMPFERAMMAEIRDGEGNTIGFSGVVTEGAAGGPAVFGLDATFKAPASTRPGKVVVYDVNEVTDLIDGIATVDVILSGTVTDLPVMTLPAVNFVNTLPLHVEVLNVTPNAKYTIQLQWPDGTQLEQQVQALPMGDRGTIVANIDWAEESITPDMYRYDAVMNVLDSNGVTVVSNTVHIANPTDEIFASPIKLYFFIGEELQEVTRYVPKTEALEAAVLRELSWGPTSNETVALGMTTALATPEEIAKFSGPRPEWSGRAYLRSLKIENGVAYVDWSREMAAWGGGSTRLHMFGEQVNATLKQFPTVESVVMTVEGSEEILQP